MTGIELYVKSGFRLLEELGRYVVSQPLLFGIPKTGKCTFSVLYGMESNTNPDDYHFFIFLLITLLLFVSHFTQVRECLDIILGIGLLQVQYVFKSIICSSMRLKNHIKERASLLHSTGIELIREIKHANLPNEGTSGFRLLEETWNIGRFFLLSIACLSWQS